MHKIWLSLAFLLIFSACDSRLEVSAPKESSDKSSANSERYKKGKKKPKSPRGHNDIPPTASQPVPLGGGYLTCSEVDPAARSIQCFTRDSAGFGVDYTALNAYVVHGSPPTWVEATLSRNPVQPGAWTLGGLPTLSSNYIVAFKTGEEFILSDWQTDPLDSPPNLVADGSFEQRSIPSSTGTTPGSDFFLPAQQGDWLAASKTGCLGILEMRSSSSTIFAKDGLQWVELDSSCNGELFSSTPDAGDNPQVYQDISLTPGNLYQVRFSYRNTSSALPQGIAVTINDGLIKEVSDNSPGWSEIKMVYRATAVNSRIAFQDSGAIDGIGAWIDAIAVEDLGTGPDAEENETPAAIPTTPGVGNGGDAGRGGPGAGRGGR